MTYDPRKHHRRSIRLKGWDYAGAGAYFVTICTHRRENLFGEIVAGEMRLNDCGRVAQWYWEALPGRVPGLQLDAYVVMPNHLHGLLVLGKGEASAGQVPDHFRPRAADASPLRPRGTERGSLGAIIQNYKSITTRRLNTVAGTPGAPVWQRNYYEHIVRDARALNAIRAYIRNNPFKWALDRDNAGNTRRLPAPASAADYLADLD